MNALKNKFRLEFRGYEFLLYHENYKEPLSSIRDVTDDFREDRPDDYDDDYGYPVIVKDEGGLSELCSIYLYPIVQDLIKEHPEFITDTGWISEEDERQITEAIYEQLNSVYFGF